MNPDETIVASGSGAAAAEGGTSGAGDRAAVGLGAAAGFLAAGEGAEAVATEGRAGASTIEGDARRPSPRRARSMTSSTDWLSTKAMRRRVVR